MGPATQESVVEAAGVDHQGPQIHDHRGGQEREKRRPGHQARRIRQVLVRGSPLSSKL